MNPAMLALLAARAEAAPPTGTQFVLMDWGSRTNNPVSGYCSWMSDSTTQGGIWLPREGGADADGNPLDPILDELKLSPHTVTVTGGATLTLASFVYDTRNLTINRFNFSPVTHSHQPQGTRYTFTIT